MQAAVQSVAVTTTAVSLPVGSVVQVGWRLSTRLELQAVYSSEAINGKGWCLSYTWSANDFPGFPGDHAVVDLSAGTYIYSYDTNYHFVTCVR
jgi:hypothetical protein